MISERGEGRKDLGSSSGMKRDGSGKHGCDRVINSDVSTAALGEEAKQTTKNWLPYRYRCTEAWKDTGDAMQTHVMIAMLCCVCAYLLRVRTVVRYCTGYGTVRTVPERTYCTGRDIADGREHLCTSSNNIFYVSYNSSQTR